VKPGEPGVQIRSEAPNPQFRHAEPDVKELQRAHVQ
jgi:hypothetical protein